MNAFTGIQASMAQRPCPGLPLLTAHRDLSEGLGPRKMQTAAAPPHRLCPSFSGDKRQEVLSVAGARRSELCRSPVVARRVVPE